MQEAKHKEPTNHRMFSPFPLCPYRPFSNPIPQPSSSTVCLTASQQAVGGDL